MAKQLLEINKFESGTVTTPDTADTPEQSATYSLNLDCVNKDGILQGAPVNAAVTIRNKDDSGNAAPDIDKARVIKSLNEDGSIKEDIIAWEDDVNKLHFITSAEAANNTTRLNHEDNAKPFEGADTIGGISFNDTPLTNVSMETHNKEVHVGLGENNPPQWMGYTNHQGLTEGAKVLVAEDAEVKYPSSLPYMHKVVLGESSKGYIYGIQKGGTRIWKIDGSNSSDAGKKVSSSTKGTFSNLQSICSDPSTGTLYVLDKLGDGYVYEVDVDDLDVKVYTYTLPSTYPGPSGSQYSDIEYTATNTKIWVAAHWDSRTVGSAASTAQLLWNFTRSGSSSTPTLANKMPRMSGGDVNTAGTWCDVLNINSTSTIEADEFVPKSTFIKETFSRSLIKHPSDAAAVYWLARYPNTGADSITFWNYRWLRKATSTIVNSGNTLTEAIDTVSSIRTLCLHRIKNDHDATVSAPDFVPIYNVYHPLGANNDDNNFSAINIDSIGIDNTGGEVYLTLGDKIEKLSGDISTSWTGIETSGNYNRYSLTTESSNTPTTGTVYNVTPTSQPQRLGVNVNFGYVSSTAAIGSAWAADGTNFVLLRQSGTAGFDKLSKTFAQNVAQTYLIDHSAISMAAADHGTNTGDLQSGYTYFYKLSVIYDGYQESPLSMETLSDVKTDTTNTTMTVTVNDFSQLPARISAVKVYRAEATTNSATLPSSLYRLVKVVLLSKAWTRAGDAYSYVFEDKGIKGASYEAESGLAESLEGTLPNYAMSTQLNNQHYIGKCWHEGYVDDASSYIFVSKVGKFDVFDWLVDFIKIPTVPTALAAFGGRIYAFDELNTYRIRGGTELYIEDVFEGVGCLNDDAIVSTDFGLFFADNKNIYQHNGQSAEPIGEPIVRGDTTAWQNRDTTYHTRAMYDATRRSVYFTFKYGNNYYAWAWNIPRKRWDLLSFGDTEGTTQPKGFYILNDTSLNVGTGTSVVKFLGGSNKRIWEWHSKDLTMGNDTQEKNIKSILVPNSLKLAYKTDGTKPTSYTDVSDPANDSNALTRLSKQTKRLLVNGKHLKIRVGVKPTQGAAAGTVDECSAISVLFKTKRSPT